MLSSSPRIRVVVRNGETVVNQCARAAIERGKGLSWFADFLRRAEVCVTLDELMKVVLRDFDIHFQD